MREKEEDSNQADQELNPIQTDEQEEDLIRDVDITDDFMFSSVMSNAEICKELLKVLLPEKKIARIRYHIENEIGKTEPAGFESQPEPQKVLQEAVLRRGVRLDVFLDDGETVYDVEMQTTRDRHLAQRTRYYQARIDADQLERGAQFDELKPCYVIFICKFDPFGQHLYLYSFVNRCKEIDDLELDDGAQRLFFNTAGKIGGVGKRLKELLAYMNDSKTFPIDQTDNPLIEKIEHAVGMAKKSPEWRRSYMTLMEKQRTAELRGIEIGENRGREQGIVIGENRGKKIGIEFGEKKKSFEIARRMIIRKFPLEQIVFCSGLTISDIQTLVEEMDQEK